MNLALYLFLDILTGMVISVMVVAKTLYGQATTMGVSLIVNHTIGLTILSVILLVGRNKPAIRGPRLKAPWYLYFNGLFGLAILNLNYYTVINTGASLAMASTVFGQSICSLFFDLTGWMGMQKRSLNKTKAVSLLISLAGILVMATSGDGTFALFYILLGILAGVLTMTQMVLNSTLAVYKGPIRASHQNFIGGLAAGLVFYFLLQGEQTLAGLAATPGLPFLLVFSGGTLAVFVVVSTSYVIVKIPAVYSALLLGSLLMLLGMGGNLAADKKANP